MSNFTKGPWFWVVNKKHKSVDLHCGSHEVMRLERYGMQGAQPTFLSDCKKYQGAKASDMAIEVRGREHHADWFMTIDHPDAQLISAAPDMYEALRMVVSCCQEDLAGGFLNADELQAIANALNKADGKGDI